MKKRLVVYPAIFDNSVNKKGIYSVEFPDVPDALTYGDNQGSGSTGIISI